MQVLSTHFSLCQGYLKYWFNLPVYELTKILFRTVESKNDSEKRFYFKFETTQCCDFKMKSKTFLFDL